MLQPAMSVNRKEAVDAPPKRGVYGRVDNTQVGPGTRPGHRQPNTCYLAADAWVAWPDGNYSQQHVAGPGGKCACMRMAAFLHYASGQRSAAPPSNAKIGQRRRLSEERRRKHYQNTCKRVKGAGQRKRLCTDVKKPKTHALLRRATARSSRLEAALKAAREPSLPGYETYPPGSC